jgi:hypothetical protein
MIQTVLLFPDISADCLTSVDDVGPIASMIEDYADERQYIDVTKILELTL